MRGHSHKGEMVVDGGRGRGELLRKEQMLEERHEVCGQRIRKSSVGELR